MYLNFKSDDFFYIVVIMIFGRGDVSKNVLYEPGDRDDLSRVEYTKRNKKAISSHKCEMFWHDQP